MPGWLTDTDIAIDTDWQVGSTITFSGFLHGQSYIDKGVVIIADQGVELAYRYLSHASKLPDTEEYYSIIHFRLSNTNTQTILSIQHSNLPDEIAYNHIKFYWPVALNEIKKLAETAM